MLSNKKFLIVGNGFIAPKHIEAIEHLGGKIIGVCDVEPTKANSKYPFVTDYKELLADADIISLCTPNYLHTEMALEAARKGKTILSEKPMSFKTEEFALLKGVPKLFGVFQLRYLPDIADMRKMASTAKDVEMVIEMKRSHTYHQTWKGDPTKTGGLLFNIGCHYFDLLGHLFGYTGFEKLDTDIQDTKATGTLVYWNTVVKWRIEFTEEQPSYERTLTIDGVKFDLVQKENLHIKVYENLMWGQGITAVEEEKIIKMIDTILK